MFKVDNKDTRTTSITSSGVFMLTLSIFHTFLLFILLTLNMFNFVGDIDIVLLIKMNCCFFYTAFFHIQRLIESYANNE